MHVTGDVILGLWIAFWTYWLVASSNAKEAHSSSAWRARIGPRVRRLAGVRVAAILVVLLMLQTGVLRGSARTTDSPVLQGIGLAILLSGLALAVWARVCLGRNWGMPMSRKIDPELVTSGPYRTIRHPIYSGIILGTIGTAISLNVYWLVAATALGIYFGYSSLVEERDMERLFPEAYPMYKRSTKRLIPFIY